MGLMLPSVELKNKREEMKKIFAYIFALAAFASCSTEINDVNTPSATLTAPMEIAVSESRAFDSDLNWGWESSDVIAAYQNAGNKSVNELKLNANGNFYNEAFEYATEESAAFHFVYPAAQLGADYSLTVAQTGAWTPILYGTVEAATVANLGTVEMNYLSSAFELRFWEAGRAARKSIVKATLTSASDFVPTWTVNGDLTYTQSLSGKELSLELNSDTAIFNLGEGDFTFNLTLVDAEGESLTYELPSKNFVAGKRTILNVEWFEGSASVNTWYEDYANNGNSALEGGAIYVTAEGGDAVVTVNGAEKAVVDGKISGLASGTYNVVVKVEGHELVNRSVVVTSIPTLSANVRTSYSSNNTVSKTNSINGSEIQANDVSLSDSYVAANLVDGKKYQFVYGGNTYNGTLGANGVVTATWGAYNCYAQVELGNGYVVKSTSYTVQVTGIPYSYDFYNGGVNEDNIKAAGWTLNGDYRTDVSHQLCLGHSGTKKGYAVSPKFYIPGDINTTTTLTHKFYQLTGSCTAYVGAVSSTTGKVQTNEYSGFNTSSTGETSGLTTHKGKDTNVVLSTSNPYMCVSAEPKAGFFGGLTQSYYYLHKILIEYR